MKTNLIFCLILVTVAFHSRGWCADGQKAVPKEAARPAPPPPRAETLHDLVLQ